MRTARGPVSPVVRNASLHSRRARSGALRRPRAGSSSRLALRSSPITRCASSAVPAFPENASTYCGSENLWVTQELPRILEMLPKHNPNDGLVLTRGSWHATKPNASTVVLKGTMRFHNTSGGRFDLFVPEVTAWTKLLSKTSSTENLSVTTKIVPKHDDVDKKPRLDGYWEAYIVPMHGATSVEVEIEITGFGASKAEDENLFASLDAAWLTVQYVVYGHHGRTQHEQKVVLPLSFPDPNLVAMKAKDDGGERLKRNSSQDETDDDEKDVTYDEDEDENNTTHDKPLRWRTIKPGLQVLCVPTHLLCHLDDPVNVVKRYAQKHARRGDFVCLGETPLAAMQGRVRHPGSVKPGFCAKVVCRLFNRFSSLATACGMQCLVDMVGATRVFAAAAAAVVLRLCGMKGIFYKLAGAQAALIDDVSGQIPPYDQSIMLGPVRVTETCDAVETNTQLPCAVVDVNDLTKVTGAFLVLGKSAGVDLEIVRVALLGNPQGNADEQTPIVLVRHDVGRRDEILKGALDDEVARKKRAKRGVGFKQK